MVLEGHESNEQSNKKLFNFKCETEVAEQAPVVADGETPDVPGEDAEQQQDESAEESKEPETEPEQASQQQTAEGIIHGRKG